MLSVTQARSLAAVRLEPSDGCLRLHQHIVTVEEALRAALANPPRTSWVVAVDLRADVVADTPVRDTHRDPHRVSRGNRVLHPYQFNGYGTIGVTMLDPPVSRRPHIIRLTVFAAFLLGLFYLVAVSDLVDIDDIRGVVSAVGPAAPLAYVVLSAVLGAVFVPGPILAAGSGVLFGPVVGTFVTLGATVGTAAVASLAGRRAGRDSARALLGPERADLLDHQIERGGLWAVVGQRFIPGISDAFAAYAFGACGVPLWQMVVGALIGSLPRAFVYTALGASIGDLSAPLAYTAIAVWCVTAIFGAFAAHRGFRIWRRHRSPEEMPEPPS